MRLSSQLVLLFIFALSMSLFVDAKASLRQLQHKMKREHNSHLVMAAAASPSANITRPKFCKTYECPTYEACTHPLYQIRKYPASSWVSIDVKLEDGDPVEQAQKYAYDLLKAYFDGKNRNNTKIPHTTPLLSEIQGSEGPQLRVTVSFWLPEEYQNDPPLPVETSPIYINKIDETTVTVEEFGGYTEAGRVATLLLAHEEELNIQAVEFDGNGYFLAIYDPPYEIFTRHNEIWLKPQEDFETLVQTKCKA